MFSKNKSRVEPLSCVPQAYKVCLQVTYFANIHNRASKNYLPLSKIWHKMFVGKSDVGVSCKIKSDQVQPDADRCVKVGTFTDYVFGFASQEGKVLINLLTNQS